MSERSTWASVPWNPVLNGGQIIGYQKHLVPYVPGGTHLQTLDVWIPPPPEVPPAADLPALPGTWVVWLHGGAWRDPKISAFAFEAAARHLLEGDISHIAGLASFNYRLSPYPGKPSDDAAHLAQHPDHVADVFAGLAFLQSLGAGKYILAGHSCGATLAFQTAMGPERWGLDGPKIAVPAAVAGFNGLYDLQGFITAPDAGFEGLRDVYEEFTRGAFGDDAELWKSVSPATADPSWVAGWTVGGGKRVTLVQSGEDTLVPRTQLEAMWQCLQGRVELSEKEANGGHDEMWVDGRRMAEILAEMAAELN